eukprot:Blabericola_migrator_1__9827@NODE_5400_length_781_cov_3_495798_g3478_i0_p1_GENE_NODE_5400_length_781_cov_3_495798_g3478_i0NODE_5400_length_781_cov_3_495798_g3478_i0_p1_ORF_typecomplete_len122_score12_68_NODE_5400_length_781_cov_3_495798_g3478_i0179544
MPQLPWPKCMLIMTSGSMTISNDVINQDPGELIANLAAPVGAVLRDRPLVRRIGKSMLVGGMAAYVPGVLLPTRGARRGAFFFGAGAGFGWSIRGLVNAAAASTRGDQSPTDEAAIETRSS